MALIDSVCNTCNIIPVFFSFSFSFSFFFYLFLLPSLSNNILSNSVHSFPFNASLCFSSVCFSIFFSKLLITFLFVSSSTSPLFYFRTVFFGVILFLFPSFLYYFSFISKKVIFLSFSTSKFSLIPLSSSSISFYFSFNSVFFHFHIPKLSSTYIPNFHIFHSFSIILIN